MALHTLCPACKYALGALPGAPAEAHGPFTAEVACPECGAVHPAGVRVFVGASSPLALIRDRSLLKRAWLRFQWERGAFNAVMYLFTVLVPVIFFNRVRDILVSGMSARHLEVLAIAGLWVFSLAWIAGVWWKRIRAARGEEVRAGESDQTLVVSAQGARDSERLLEASTIRRIRVIECMPAANGGVVVAIDATARTRFGFHQATVPVYTIIPRGTAQTLADGLMATVRGRSEPAVDIGDEVIGETPPVPILAGWVRSLLVALIPIVILLALAVHPLLFGFLPPPLIALLVIALVGEVHFSRPVAWRLAGGKLPSDSIEVCFAFQGRIGSGAETRFAIALSKLRCLELRQHRGMPHLRLHARSMIGLQGAVPLGHPMISLEGAVPLGHLDIVPNDMLGMTPVDFAQKLAERLRIPLRISRLRHT